jgi:hypothetical protein
MKVPLPRAEMRLLTEALGEDEIRIDVSEDYELDYWSRKFQVSRDEVRSAVAKVGPIARHVQAHLRTNT